MTRTNQQLRLKNIEIETEIKKIMKLTKIGIKLPKN